MEVKGIESQNKSTQEVQAETIVGRKHSRKRNIVVFVVVTALNIALLALLANQLLTPAQKNPVTGQPVVATNSNAIGDVGSPLIGKMAPDFTLSTLKDGATNVSLTDFKGHPVILNFWASWCDPCQAETPFLQKSWPDLKSQGIVLVGIDGQESAGNALKFLQQKGVTYPSVQDSVNGATAINYGVLGFPETLFIDRHGVVVGKWSGELDEAGLAFELKKLMASN